MKNFLILFREPDGRTITHSEKATKEHQLNWKTWLEEYGKQGTIIGGNALTLNGKLIKGKNKEVIDKIHSVGTEIVGGFLIIKSKDLNEATELIKSCPIFEFDGYAEVREIQ